MKAALVSEPRRLDEPAEDKKAWVGFWLGGMSAGVRLREGDHVLLMPESARSDRVLRDWEATLDTMAWDSKTSRYRCKALTTASAADELERLGQTEAVYLYPTSMDIWSGRLLDNKDALLRCHGGRLGRSWGTVQEWLTGRG